jgi:glycosyltransferase involved in cell wall biosynthesis
MHYQEKIKMQAENLPLVSVLMTAYNREKYIAYAIESVLASTYTNLELIITDDGSKDRTVEIAHAYADKDQRVKVYVNEKNLGDYPNRNRAASYAKGKYLKYVDADDYIYPSGIQVLVSMMETYPSAGWGLCSLMQVKDKPYPILISPYEAYRYTYFGPGLFHKAPLSSIIKRDVFEAVSGFKEMRMVGDFEMWHRLALNYPVLLMPDGIVWYRKHEEQEVNDITNYLINYEQVSSTYLSDVRCPLSKNEIDTIFTRRKKQVFWNILKILFKLRFKSLLKELKLFLYLIRNT